MENSLNSSTETTVSGAKAVFKKPKNINEGFNVSMEESFAVAQNNKSDLGLDITSGTSKEIPFKKTRKSIQHSFNVTSGESLINSESEQSVTATKPQELFTKQNKSLVDFFNVSFDETTHADGLTQSIDIDESVTVHKTNPFAKNKKNVSHNDVSIRMETSMAVSEENENGANENLRPSHSCLESINESETDSTTFITKPNPFKKSNKPENNSLSELNVTVTEENRTSEEPDNNNVTVTNSGVNDTADLTVYETKSNPFKSKKSDERDVSQISITEDHPKEDPRRTETPPNNFLNESVRSSRNQTSEQSISKVPGSTSYLEQSSINDDNLNNWMSDQSDDEMPPPTVPTLTANLSGTKEKPGALNTTQPESNPLSEWEQKVNEIVSNATKKSQGSKIMPASPKKDKLLKKSRPTIQKTVSTKENNEDTYKPPKLIKPAKFATKQLYAYIIKQLEPKFGIDTMIEAENLVVLMCDTVKKVTQRKAHQKKLIDDLKKEMARLGLIETTMDFYEFIIKFLPYSFRVKVVPCLQPVTNMVYPPKNVANPFDKIL